jgi:polyhydroxybutyrate depolymerase
MPLRSRLGLLFILVCFLGVDQATASSSKSPQIDEKLFEEITLQVEGHKREAHLYDPRSDKTQPRPLLIVFHGSGGTSLGSEKLSGLQKWALEKNFLLLYPQGLDKVWNDGRNKKAEGHADLAYFDQLLALMKHRYKVDAGRIYLAGMSNGGLFSFRLACERAHEIQGIASVTANMGEALAMNCKPSRPLSVLLIVGTEDPLMPFAGGEVTGPWGKKKLGRVLSAEKTLEWWTQNLKCPQAQKTETLESAQSIRIETRLHAPCQNSHQVKGIFLHGAGHTWPSGWQYLRESIIGKTSRQLSASEEITKFFNL